MNAKLKKKIQSKGFVVKEPLVPDNLIITTPRAKMYAVELEKLNQKYDVVTPEVIVNEAKKQGPGHPLYDYFDWDVKSAAKKHWLNQAREIIRIVKVTYLEDPTPQFAKRGIVTVVRDDGQRTITGIQSALATERTRMAMIARELSIIASCKERLKAYAEMQQLIPLLNHALEEGSVLLGKVEKKKLKKAS
jgi:hypothetical protein